MDDSDTCDTVTLRLDSGRMCSQVSKKAAVSVWQVLEFLATCDGVSRHSISASYVYQD